MRVSCTLSRFSGAACRRDKSVIPLEDIPLPEIRSAVAELRRSLTRG